jgi:hypothetical protein
MVRPDVFARSKVLGPIVVTRSKSVRPVLVSRPDYLESGVFFFEKKGNIILIKK